LRTHSSSSSPSPPSQLRQQQQQQHDESKSEYKDDVFARTDNDHPFLSIFVGCNKAIDAVSALQWGSRDVDSETFSVDKWRDVLSKGNTEEFAGSSCAQFDREYRNKKHKENSTSTLATQSTEQQHQQHVIHPATVYCLEPMPKTVR
jgi:hypothetical protein